MNEDITQQIYNFIRDYIEEHGHAPSQREIASGCFIALGTVSKYLAILQVQGLIDREKRHTRSISLSKQLQNESEKT